MSKVLIREATYEKVADVIEEVFDAFQVDLRGQKVLLKPNICAPFPPESAVTTHPAVVKAVLDKVLTMTRDVVVGDNFIISPATGRLDETARTSGILEVCGEYYCNPAQDSELTDIGSSLVDKVMFSRQPKEADFIINLPKFKTHILPGISLCIKNLFGYVPGAHKARMHFVCQKPKALSQFFVDLYKYATPKLNIMDAILAMEGDGPTHGNTRPVGKIIAGTNGVEVDMVCAAMMGMDPPTKFKMLDIAYKEGLGEMDLSKIDIDGPFEVLPNFRLPTTYVEPEKHPWTMEQIHDGWGEVMVVRPECHEDLCSYCATCHDICPAGAITMDPGPVIDQEKCIACFCCAEACPEGALLVPKKVPWLYEGLLANPLAEPKPE